MTTNMYLSLMLAAGVHICLASGWIFVRVIIWEAFACGVLVAQINHVVKSPIVNQRRGCSTLFLS